MALQLQRFSQALFTNTKSEWLKQIDSLGEGIVFAPNYEQKLDVVQNKLNEKTGTIHVYAITDDDIGDHALAIIELSHAMPKTDKAWLKLLNITVQPDYDINAGKVSMTQQLIPLITACIVEAYMMIYDEHPSTTLKVLGSNAVSMELLRGLAADLKEAEIDADTQGGWLVIKKMHI